jgi:hypothetical protein
LRDPFWMRLPFEAKGLLSHIECMAGSTLEGYEKGVLYGTDGGKLSVDELLFLIGDGSSARNAEISGMLSLLVTARQLDKRAFDAGAIKLVHWHEDQETPASGDVERHQMKASEELVEEAEALHGPLAGWFAELGGRKVTEAELNGFLYARTGKYEKTRIRILRVLFDSGFLVRDSSALASLALPPAGVGVGAVSARVGSGGEIVPAGKFPADQDQDPDKDSLTGIQLVPVGAGAGARPLLEGGERERSEGGGFLPPAIRGGHVPPSREERPIPPPECSEDCLFEPSDAFVVKDPIHATERFLSGTSGWNSIPPRHGFPSDPPLSQDALLSQYAAMSKRLGPKEATAMWRECLSRLVADFIDRRASRRQPPHSWAALFMSQLQKASGARPYRRAGMNPAHISGRRA